MIQLADSMLPVFVTTYGYSMGPIYPNSADVLEEIKHSYQTNDKHGLNPSPGFQNWAVFRSEIFLNFFSTGTFAHPAEGGKARASV